MRWLLILYQKRAGRPSEFQWEDSVRGFSGVIGLAAVLCSGHVVAALGGGGAHWIVAGGHDRAVFAHNLRKGEAFSSDLPGLLSLLVGVDKDRRVQ